MTGLIHYHGTPITPAARLLDLAGRCFCVSFADPRQADACHRIGQSVMLDNGAFSAWRSGTPTDWPGYYAWSDRWLDWPTTWAVVPDIVDGGAEANDALLLQWPHGQRGAPVWHLNEPIDRLLRLVDEWERVCWGSAGAYAVVGSDPWHRRAIEAWDTLARRPGRTPWIHILRGLSLSGGPYPFASADSTDIARNHAGNARARTQSPRAMADRWDARQCPGAWTTRGTEQLELIA